MGSGRLPLFSINKPCFTRATWRDSLISNHKREDSMNWEILGALGEIIGGLGVIFSLLYLARQISDNTSSNQSAAITDLTNQIMKITILDDAAGKLFHYGLKDLDNLTDAERLIFVQRVTAIFLVWFNAHLQHQRKLIPNEFWDTFAGDIASYFQHPGIVDTWEMIKTGFPEDYVHYVEFSSAMESRVDYLAGSY